MRNLFNYIFILFFITLGNSQIVNISFNMTKGQEYKPKIEQTINITQDIFGETNLMKIVMSGEMNYKVSNIKDGVNEIDVKYKSMTLRTTNNDEPEQVISSDEFEANADSNSQIISKYYSAMINQTFKIFVNNKGKIINITDLDKVLKTVTKSLKAMRKVKSSKEIKDFVMENMWTYLEDGMVKSTIEEGLDYFPQDDVNLDKKWKRTTTNEHFNNTIKMSNFQLKEIGRYYYMINMEAAIKTIDAESKEGIDVFNQNFTLISGTETGVIKVNKDDCFPIHQEKNTYIKGTSLMVDDAGKEYNIPTEVRIKSIVTD